MGIRMNHRWRWLPVVFALCALPASAQVQQFWSVEVLDHSPSRFVDFNNLNQVLINNEIWDLDNGTSIPLGDFGGGLTLPLDMNNLGHVVGWSLNAAGDAVPFLWDPEEGMRDLSDLTGVTLQPVAINDHGQIVGSSFTTGGDLDQNLLWHPVDGLFDLGTFQPIALNNNGQVVGRSGDQAAIWDAVNGVRSLGNGWPEAINDNGEVAGSDDGAGFVWDAVNGRRNFFGYGSTVVYSIAGITASGHVVGSLLHVDEDTGRLFIYKHSVVDLHPTGSSLISTGALGVNDDHLILGASQDGSFAVALTLFRPQDGALQEVPIMPLAGAAGEWFFYEVPSGAWFDPPTAAGFDYEMLSASLFTSVLDFPTGFNGRFTIVTDGCEIPGSFGPGDSVDFVALCGRGVPAFGVRGIDPARDPSAPHFPLRLAFDTPIADFRMRALIEGGTADTVPPILSATRTPGNIHGWNNGEVVVTFSCTDADSAIAIPPIGPVTLSGEGAGQSVSATCEDAAGNRASLTIDNINIDRTAPLMSASRSPDANEFGWNNTDVTASFSCTDTLSGVEPGSVTPDTTLTAEGANQSVAAECRDLAGNVGATDVDRISIDKTAPTVTCAATPTLLWPPNFRMVPVNTSVTVADELSGAGGLLLASAASSEPDVSEGRRAFANDIESFVVGTAATTGRLRAERDGGEDGRIYTLGYEGHDRAGNVGTCAARVSVPHDQQRR